MAGDGVAPAVPEKDKSKSSLLPSLRLQSLDELLVGAVLKAGPTGTSVQGNKEALSLQATSVNFRRFVQKSGPIFVAQDAVESVVRWEDAAKTSFFAAAWAILCYWPSLVVLIPNVVLVSILLTTYQARKGAGAGNNNLAPPESQDGPTPLAKDPPSEGSVDYFANLQNIQIMMGRVADLTDVLRSFVPYLTWRDERLTRCLLLLSVLSSFLLATIAHSIPWRLVFLVVGESTLLCGHPLVQTFLADAKQRGWTAGRRKRFWNVVERLLEDDELRDDELDGEVVEVQRIEVESRVGPAGGGGVAAASNGDNMSGVRTAATAGADPSSASGGGAPGGSTSPSSLSSFSSSSGAASESSGINNLDSNTHSSEGWQTEAIVGGDLPSGFRWLGSHWQDPIPPSSSSSDAAEPVDAHGWTYIFLDGSRAPTPTKMVPPAAAGGDDKLTMMRDRFVVAQTRRRRLVRRAIKNPLL
ncbi:hypothetical protein JCM8115_003008 [Rhodotorula mucilaginosa]